MKPTFEQINRGWNADPNGPEPRVAVVGSDVLLTFYVNAFQFEEFEEGELGILRFVDCERYRLGSTNDEGWYRGQCRFSTLAPEWGEFYIVSGDEALLNAPEDWKLLEPSGGVGKHFLFYFRDHTFECVAKQCTNEKTASNSLQRTGFAGR
jgi:hypothetical protein